MSEGEVTAGIEQLTVNDQQQQQMKSCRCFVGNLNYATRWQALKDHMRVAGEVVFADVMMNNDGRSRGCGIVEYSCLEDAQKAFDTMNDTVLDGRKIYVRENRDGPNPKYSNENQDGEPRQNFRNNRRNDSNNNNSNWSSNNNNDSNNNNSRSNNNKWGNNSSSNTSTNWRSGGEGNAATIKSFDSRNNPQRDDSGKRIFIRNLPYSTKWQDLKELFSEAGEIVRADINLDHDGRSRGFGTVTFASADSVQIAVDKFNGTLLDGRELLVKEDSKFQKEGGSNNNKF